MTPPLVVDLFAGGGGAGTGVARALGRSADFAVNHDPAAVAMYRRNHPSTTCLLSDVFDVSPRALCGRRRPKLVWASPDCTHFSRAKGAAPRSNKIRGLAWVAAEWARAVKPEVMIIENVREFLTWGPLDDEGQPIKARAGETFAAWLQHLTLAGYDVEWRVLRACDYGAPTIRERLYIIARSDGRPIVWPAPTHGAGRPLPYRTAAECIDWTIPVRSIFDRKKPLAAATQRRIAEGLRRFVIESASPFIAPLRGTSTAHRSVHDVNAPLSTVSAGGTHHALVVPYLANTRNGEAPGQAPRVRALDEPYWTTTAKGSQGALVTAWISKHFTGVVGSDLRKPLGTVTAKDHNALTIAATYGDHADAVAAFLVQYYGSGSAWQSLSDPMRTVVTKARFGLVEVAIGGEPHIIHDIGMRMLEPRELARANGLPDSQILTGTKAQQIARIGNMVCPDVAEALVRANVVDAEAAA